jgi:hypothetical protein
MRLRFSNITKSIIVLILLTISLFSCTPASSPMDVRVDIEGEPTVEATVDLLVTISTREDANNISFSLGLSPGLKLVAGSPSWQGRLQKGESIVLSFSVKVLEEGDWPLAAYAFNAYSPDSDSGFGNGETIYLVSRQSSGDVIPKSDYEGTPSSPAINQP